VSIPAPPYASTSSCAIRTAGLGKRLLALATLSACAGTGFGQSSVTVFGIVDLAARAVSNNDTQYQLASGGLQSSRLGFRGTEDLGDGYSAGFWLEGQLEPDTGNANGFDFRRRSTVSLLGRNQGELRLGRDKVPTTYEWEDFDPFRDAGIGRSTRLQAASGIVPSRGTFGTASRANNVVSYLTPGTLGGFFGQASVAAGEGQLGNKYKGGRVGYRSGPLMVSGSYGQTEVTADINAEVWSLGGTYDLQVVRLWGFVSSLEIGTASQDNWLLGVTAPLGPVELRVSHQRMAGSGRLDGQEATMVAVGGVYPLSRRTALYVTYSRIDNDGTSFTVAPGGPLNRGNTSDGYELGIRHAF
jgi:predicted porin